MEARLGFIGAGNMASALIGGLQAKGGLAHPPVVIDPSPAARELLHARFGAEVHPVPGTSLRGCQAIVVAVKPQQMRAAVESLAAALAPPPGILFISVAAGIPTSSICRWIGREVPVVRSMPNTPALIGAGIAGLYANAAVDPTQRALADALLSAVGSTVWVEDESLLDAVTAVSGSGPAYVFYFIEALEKAARELGLSPEASLKLAMATFSGATQLAAGSADSLEVLRERVTSKGGTTHAALSALAAEHVAEHIIGAVHAAARRAVEMGQEFGQD